MAGPALQFASLGSGSRGNGTVVRCNGTCVLVDCGFSLRETRSRLARLGLALEQISAVLVTHEHGDHLRGVAPLARAVGMPVWMSGGTARALREEIPGLHLLNCHRAFAIGDLEVQPYPVPHDAREPCQFVFGDGARRLGVLTDSGIPTRHMVELLSGCDALFLECNHDSGMLARSAYPPSVRARIGGRLGHLSNQQAASFLSTLDCSRLQHLVAAHLSEQNNQAHLAREALAGALGCEAEWIGIASQDGGLGWREIL
ncbi:MAG TPA: MBL fold metallo-hydrolase [Gammaproteobacteria bacterium]|nr:MBL fold metallo-hydrolase [Gammaproteobacteria bacterium]